MKTKYLAAGAVALVAAYFLMRGGSGSPLGSGGGLEGQAGLPPIAGSGGGGSDTPTVNIDFPAMPLPQIFEEPTKKEEQMQEPQIDDWRKYIGQPPSPDYSTYTAPSWKDPSNPNMTAKDITNMFASVREMDAKTKKEEAITSVWDLRLLFAGGDTTEQRVAAMKPAEKFAPTSFGGTQYRQAAQGKFKMNLSPYVAPTKKEVSTRSRSGGSSGGSDSSYTGTVGNMPGGIPLNLSTGQSWLSSKGF